MRILITNDDGIMAPGIQALYQAVCELGEVEVVAPQTTQSAVSHGISVQTPMLVHRMHVNGVFHGWSVDGRPADCVKLAMHELLEWKPDFVLSGINAGANTGVNVLYSGTVAGAVEAVFFGVPSMAFSLNLSDELDFHRAGKIAASVFENFAAAKPPPDTCISVNIPALDDGLPRGVRVCPQAAHPMQEHYVKQTDKAGRTYYHLDGRLPEKTGDDQSDLAAMLAGYVTLTPLRFDMTDHALLGSLGDWGWPRSFS
jgi:5'-nucleotidase